MTNEEFLAETKALERMLADFDKDVSSISSSDSDSNSTYLSSSSSSSSGASSASAAPSAPAAPNAASSAAAAQSSSPLSMARLMRTYEDELRRPVKNLLSGQLARCLLIQLQKVKVDSSSALLEMDQVLRANELSLAATAAVPALAAVYVVGLGVRRVFFARRRPLPDPRRAAAPLRSAFADAEDALVLAAAAAAAEEKGEGRGAGDREGAVRARARARGGRRPPRHRASPRPLLLPLPLLPLSARPPGEGGRRGAGRRPGRRRSFLGQGAAGGRRGRLGVGVGVGVGGRRRGEVPRRAGRPRLALRPGGVARGGGRPPLAVERALEVAPVSVSVLFRCFVV